MTSFSDVIQRGGEGGVPWHEHDASDISGNAEFLDLVVDRLLAGTITGKEIIIAGGVSGVLRSSNFVAGSAGWQVLGDGNAEFNNVTIRGSLINLPSGTSFPVSPSDGDLFYRTDENRTYRYDGSAWIPQDYTADGTRIANTIIGTAHIIDANITSAKFAGTIQSDNFVAGTSGWQIRRDTGSAEFNDITVRGTIYANAGELGTLTVTGTLTMGVGGVFRTASSGKRIEMNNSFVDVLNFYSGAPNENLHAQIVVTDDGGPELQIQGGSVTASSTRATIFFEPDGTLGFSAPGGWMTMLHQARFAIGSAASPGVAFNGASNYGMYYDGDLVWAVAGVSRMRLGSSFQINIPSYYYASTYWGYDPPVDNTGPTMRLDGTSPHLVEIGAAFSSVEHKTQVEPIDLAVSPFDQLDGIRFRFRPDARIRELFTPKGWAWESGRPRLGVSAEQMEEVEPAWVSEWRGEKIINWEGLTPDWFGDYLAVRHEVMRLTERVAELEVAHA